MTELNYKNFLYSLWGLYSSSQPLYYEIFILKNEKPRVLFFSDVDSAIAWLDNNLQKFSNADVYYGVLPRSKIKEKGRRGSEEDVDSGLYLWVDLDYKKEMTKDEFERFLKKANRTDIDINKDIWYEEHKDHVVIGFYKKEDKYIVFTRPSLSYVLEKVKKKIGIEPSIVVDSGNGYHLYFRLKYDIDAKRLKKLEKALVKTLGGDQNATDLARVLRLPSSINQRTGRKCSIIFYNINNEYDPDELEKKLDVEEQSKKVDIKEDKEEEKKEEEKSEQTYKKELTNEQILEIVKTLEPIYKTGARHEIILYLVGWLYKLRISYESAERLIKTICEHFKDEECQDRLYTLKDTYGVNKTPRQDRLKIQGKGLKTKGGLYDLIVNEKKLVNEEIGLSIIKKIEEILNSASPYKLDPVFAILNINNKKYAIALPSLKAIFTAHLSDDNNVIYEEKVVDAYPLKVVMYQDPVDPTKVTFETVWKSAVRPITIRLPPLPVADIISYLDNAGLIIKNRLSKDVITAILNAYVKKKKAQVRADVDSKGFFIINNELRVSRVRVTKPEDVKKAVELIDKLRQYFDESKLAYVLAWGLASPFNFILKQRLANRASDVYPYLILFGESNAGKSTLSLIACYVSGSEVIANEKCEEVDGTKVDTIPKLGMFLNDSTFMKPVKEAWGLFKDIEKVEMLKDVVDNTIARARIEEKSRLRTFLALRPLLMTLNRIKNSNIKFPDDPGFRRRYKIIPFTLNDTKKIEGKRDEFNKLVYPHLPLLGNLGMLFAYKMLNDKQLQEKYIENPLEVTKQFLKQLLQKYGFESDWLDKNPEFEGNEREVDIENVRSFFINKINDVYQKYIGKLVVVGDGTQNSYIYSTINIKSKIDVIIDAKLLPYMLKKDDRYIITSAIKNDEDFYKSIGEITLKDLAELLHEGGVTAEYTTVKIKDKAIKCIILDPKTFESFLNLTSD